jgi:hypothetical protein
MPRKQLEVPPAVARAFVKDMKAFFAEKNAIKRDEIPPTKASKKNAGSIGSRLNDPGLNCYRPSELAIIAAPALCADDARSTPQSIRGREGSCRGYRGVLFVATAGASLLPMQLLG